MSFELDQEPFECEAFPGLVWTLRGDREAIHLCALEEKHLGEGHPQLILGIDRRGHLLRHPFQTMPLLPASADGRIALVSARPTPPPPSASRETWVSHPALVARFSLVTDGESLRLYAQSNGGATIPVAAIASNGKLRRIPLSSGDVRRGREMGLRFSDDGAIAIHNPFRSPSESVASAPNQVTSPNIHFAEANAEGWRAYVGSGMPESADTLVQISTASFPDQRSARDDVMPARDWNWHPGTSIRFYRIVGEPQTQVTAPEDEPESLAFPEGTDTLTAAKLLRISYRKSVAFFEANEDVINQVADRGSSSIESGTSERRHFQAMIDRLNTLIECLENEAEAEAEAEDDHEDLDIPEDETAYADPEE